MPDRLILAPADPSDLREAVEVALRGGPAILAGDAGPDELDRLGPLVPAGTALVVPTSGSTGTPRAVALPADALLASARATHARLGGPGTWILTLPATHVAGLQVVVRSVVAATPLVAAPVGEKFTLDGLADLIDATPGARRYLSLVPTQLHRAVHDATPASARALSALGTLDAVLLGGAATPPDLLARARATGVPVVTTYGMTETSGGCVYAGVPLDGVRVRQGEGGVLEISGPTLAACYLGDDAATAESFVGTGPDDRWFRTSDVGTVENGPAENGTLENGTAENGPTRVRVLGRADDVVLTGGVNVAPAAVEAAISGVEGAGEVCVVGVPDPEWGEVVVAVVTPGPVAPGVPTATEALLGRVRVRVATTLGSPSAPRHVLVVDELPHRGPGKIDRSAVRAYATRALGR